MTITYSVDRDGEDGDAVRNVRCSVTVDTGTLDGHLEAIVTMMIASGLNEANIRHMFNRWLGENETGEQQAETVNELLGQLTDASRAKILKRWTAK
jgi:hypothetical protein